jgi:hypothetical protein
MAALVEGLAGVTNMPGTQAYASPSISSRWTTTSEDSISVCIRYAASKAYVAYKQYHHKEKKQIELSANRQWKKNEGSSAAPSRTPHMQRRCRKMANRCDFKIVPTVMVQDMLTLIFSQPRRLL